MFYIKPAAKCQDITAESGWIASPNHPGNYPDNANFCWLIKSKQPIALSIIYFWMDTREDHIAVYTNN